MTGYEHTADAPTAKRREAAVMAESLKAIDAEKQRELLGFLKGVQFAASIKEMDADTRPA